MHPDAVRRLYDDGYAASYDERYLTGEPWSRHGADYQVEVLAELVEAAGPDARWLDVGCGTGWFLSRFPGVDRTGLDLSPSMLARARTADPDVDLLEGSFLDPHPELEDRFDIVSCLWFAYCYVDTIDDIDVVVEHLARWTAPGGTCVVQICDAEDVANGLVLPYEDPETPIFGGSLFIDTVLWTWVEPDGTRHEHLVAPHLQSMVDRFDRWFDDLEVRRWPAFAPGWGRRKAIIARRRRTEARPGRRSAPATETFPPAGHPLEAPGLDQDAPADAPAPEPVDLGHPSWRRRLWARTPASLRTMARTAFAWLPASLRRRLDPRRATR